MPAGAQADVQAPHRPGHPPQGNTSLATLTFLATHLKASKGFEATRRAQVAHLMDILAEQGAERVILAGDFNAG